MKCPSVMSLLPALGMSAAVNKRIYTVCLDEVRIVGEVTSRKCHKALLTK